VTSLLSSGDLISDRYASALYDLAAEKKIVYLVLEDLVFLQKCIQENKDLKLLAKSPLITSSDKLNIFEKINLICDLRPNRSVGNDRTSILSS